MARTAERVTIKRYDKRGLHNAGAGRYLALEEIAGMVEDDEDFVVVDANTGEDVTHTGLKQIIVERTQHG